MVNVRSRLIWMGHSLYWAANHWVCQQQKTQDANVDTGLHNWRAGELTSKRRDFYIVVQLRTRLAYAVLLHAASYPRSIDA